MSSEHAGWCSVQVVPSPYAVLYNSTFLLEQFAYSNETDLAIIRTAYPWLDPASGAL